MKAVFLTLALVLLTCSLCFAAALDIPLLWTAELNTVIENCATVADINGDGRDEAVIAGYTQLIALDGSGKVMWEWENSSRFGTYPAILPRPGASALIYVADGGGHLTCLDGSGKVIWSVGLKAPSSWSASVVCDLRGDGSHQVIQTDRTGAVWAFDALTGGVVWQASVEAEPVSPAVGDLDGDGKPEIVVATGKGVITALRRDGSPLWRRTLGSSISPDWQTSAPVIFSAADGSRRVVVGSSAGEFFCFDAAGQILWKHALNGPVTASISVADFDGDGLADVFLVTELGVIYHYREDGVLLWSLDMQGRTLAPGAIVDVNGDGKLEYVLCTQNGRLLVFDQQGEVLFDRQFNHRTINGTPAFGHLGPRSAGTEMVITGGESGRVLCFGTAAPADAPIPWSSYRHDTAMLGSVPPVARETSASITAENLSSNQILCGQGVRFRVTNPAADGRRFIATATCRRPDGVRQAVIMRVAESRGELNLPVEPLVPGVYAFTWSLTGPDGLPAGGGSKEVFIQPFVSDRALIGRAGAGLRSAADSAEAVLALSAAALRREARSLDAAARDLVAIQEAALAPGADEAARSKALTQTAGLVASAQRALRIAEIVRQAVALGPGATLIAFEPANPWENRQVAGQLPDRVVAPLVVHRRAVPGEHEPVALSIFNITDRTVQVRLRVETKPGGPAVAALRAMAVPTPMGEQAWDALLELDESGTVAVPSLSTAQFWLDLDLANAQAGNHEITVRLEALDGAGVLEPPQNRGAVPPPETVVKIALEVPPFQMAPPGSFRLCTWGNVEGSQYQDWPDATYDNLLAHGNNVYTVGGLPAATYDASGAVTEPLDYRALDAAVGRFRGKDVVLLLNGFPPLSPAAGAAEYGSPAYRKALKAYLADLTAHLNGLGFSREQFALYPVDEPGGNGWPTVRRLVEFGEMVRAAAPGVLIYVDGGGDVPMFQALAPVVDIWSPGIGTVATEPEKIAAMRGPGKQLWSYDCGYGNASVSGRTLKAGDVVAMYRTAAICAFGYGLTGAGFWTSILGPEDPWTRTEGYDYMILYTGRSKPVTSRRWEAVREGIEDFRILTALRRRLEATGDGALTDATRASIKHLLEVSVPRLTDRCMDLQAIPQHLEETLNAVRGEMLDCVAAVARQAGA